MAVIVDQRLAAQRLGSDDEARRSIWAQSGDGPDDPVVRDLHGRQAARCGGRPARGGGGAAGQQQRAGGEGAGAEDLAAGSEDLHRASLASSHSRESRKDEVRAERG
jgi:hypothetical protein